MIDGIKKGCAATKNAATNSAKCIASAVSNGASKTVDAIIDNDLIGKAAGKSEKPIEYLADKACSATITIAKKAIPLVAEIEKSLLENNSSYQINEYSVRTTLGITLGTTLDIRFSKTPTAKAEADFQSKTVEIISPSGNAFKVNRLDLLGKDVAKIRDPFSKEILLVNTKTLEVLPADQK